MITEIVVMVVMVMVVVVMVVIERMLTCYKRFVHVVKEKKVKMGCLQLPHTALLHPVWSAFGIGIRTQGFCIAEPGFRIRPKDQNAACFFVASLPSAPSE